MPAPAPPRATDTTRLLASASTTTSPPAETLAFWISAWLSLSIRLTETLPARATLPAPAPAPLIATSSARSRVATSTWPTVETLALLIELRRVLAIWLTETLPDPANLVLAPTPRVSDRTRPVLAATTDTAPALAMAPPLIRASVSLDRLLTDTPAPKPAVPPTPTAPARVQTLLLSSALISTFGAGARASLPLSRKLSTTRAWVALSIRLTAAVPARPTPLGPVPMPAEPARLMIRVSLSA